MAKPNILLITSDQQHWNTIGAFNPELSTPHLDRLVREGTTFSRAYCPNPTCTPSRSSIITGKYPSQHGAWTLGTKLPEEETTVGELLQKEGYRTALVGKAHFQPVFTQEPYTSLEGRDKLHDFAFWREFNGPFYGFGHIELLRNHTNEYLVGQHYALWMEEKGCGNWRDYYSAPTGTMDESVPFSWPIPEQFHYNTWIAERSNELMEEYSGKDEPFMLWASFPDPHPPYLVPEPWASMYDPEQLTVPRAVPGEHEHNPPHFQMTQEAAPDFSSYKETGYGIHGYHSHLGMTDEEHRRAIATYYGMVSFMDDAIGSILNKLDALGIADHTIVVFTTDHGHLFGQHGMMHKGGFHYEDLLRLPFIVRYPGHTPAGAVSGSIQSLVDLAPTFLHFAGGTVPHAMTGLDQSAVWLDPEKAVRDHAICEFRHEPTTIHQKTYVGQRYKLTVYYNQSYGELFDLEEDPQEIHNLWNDEAHQSLKMELLMKYIWAELGKESMPMPRVSHA